MDALLQAAFSCGSAVELISKAYLASLSHSFLTDKGERDSLFMFAGHGALANTSATQVRSIGALDVARVLKHLHRESPLDLQDPVALRVRNSAAHMALVDAGELRLGVIQMVKVVEMILPLLDLEPEAFWGDHAVPVVSALLDQARTEIARVVQAKISAAKERLALLTKSLAADQVVILLATLSGRATSPSEHNEQQVCPVCGQQGWLLCNIERGEVQYQDGADPWVTQTAYPFEFDCPVCQLDVAEEELREFGFPAEFRLDDDAADDDELWEPDEDYYRDR